MANGSKQVFSLLVIPERDYTSENSVRDCALVKQLGIAQQKSGIAPVLSHLSYYRKQW